MKKTKASLFFERKKVTVIRLPRRDLLAFCGQCAKQVRMFAATDAATFVGVETASVYQHVADMTIHFHETNEGLLLICGDSLARVYSSVLNAQEPN